MFQILINGKAYDMEFAENKTSADIIQMLPLKLSMQAYSDIEYYAELPERPFLNANDWSQKTVIPFMTHGGWPGHVIKDIQNGCVGAKFLPDMKIQFDSQGGANMLTSQADINAWIERVKKAI